MGLTTVIPDFESLSASSVAQALEIVGGGPRGWSRRCTVASFGFVRDVVSPLEPHRKGATVAYDIDRNMTAQFARSGWAARRSDLVDLGISARAIDRRVAAGSLRSFGNGVIGPRDAPDPLRQLETACLLAHDGGVLSHRSAANRHGMPIGQPPARPDVLVGHGRHRVTIGATVRQTVYLPAIDRSMVDGLRLTSVARTLCDLAQVIGVHRLQYQMQWSIKEGLCDRAQVQACARSLHRQGRAGSAVRREAIDMLGDDVTIQASELERRFLDLLVDRSIEGAVWQYRPPWYDGRRGIVDVAFPATQTVVELDSRRWHSLMQDQARDRQRDRTARSHGWIVLRYGWDELTTRPDEIIADLVRALHSRVPAAIPRV